jgi:hypothetical protein
VNVGDINEDTRRALRSLRWEESSIVSVDHELPEDEVDDAKSICNAATVGDVGEAGDIYEIPDACRRAGRNIVELK